MSSGSSLIRETLEGYVAGRVKAERLVIAVAAAYYGREGAPGIRDGLGPLVDIIDRASPGIVELGGVAEGRQGFDIRLAERSFPRQYEQEPVGRSERHFAGGRLVKRDPQGIEVHALVERSPLGLLGGEVLRRPDRHVHAGRSDVARQGARDTEVREDRTAVRLEQDVAG